MCQIFKTSMNKVVFRGCFHSNVIFTYHQLVSYNVHLGGLVQDVIGTSYWFLYAKKDNFVFLNLLPTLLILRRVLRIVENLIYERRKIMFVNNDLNMASSVYLSARECAEPFSISTWVGGTLTNFKLLWIFYNQYLRFFSWKELSKPKARLKFSLQGLSMLMGPPGLVFVNSLRSSKCAADEAHAIFIPVVGLVDVDSNSGDALYMIPANDNSLLSVGFFNSIFARLAINCKFKMVRKFLLRKYMWEQRGERVLSLNYLQNVWEFRRVAENSLLKGDRLPSEQWVILNKLRKSTGELVMPGSMETLFAQIYRQWIYKQMPFAKSIMFKHLDAVKQKQQKFLSLFWDFFYYRDDSIFLKDRFHWLFKRNERCWMRDAGLFLRVSSAPNKRSGGFIKKISNKKRRFKWSNELATRFDMLYKFDLGGDVASGDFIDFFELLLISKSGSSFDNKNEILSVFKRCVENVEQLQDTSLSRLYIFAFVFTWSCFKGDRYLGKIDSKFYLFFSLLVNVLKENLAFKFKVGSGSLNGFLFENKSKGALSLGLFNAPSSLLRITEFTTELAFMDSELPVEDDFLNNRTLNLNRLGIDSRLFFKEKSLYNAWYKEVLTPFLSFVRKVSYAKCKFNGVVFKNLKLFKRLGLLPFQSKNFSRKFAKNLKYTKVFFMQSKGSTVLPKKLIKIKRKLFKRYKGNLLLYGKMRFLFFTRMLALHKWYKHDLLDRSGLLKKKAWGSLSHTNYFYNKPVSNLRKSFINRVLHESVEAFSIEDFIIAADGTAIKREFVDVHGLNFICSEFKTKEALQIYDRKVERIKKKRLYIDMRKPLDFKQKQILVKYAKSKGKKKLDVTLPTVADLYKKYNMKRPAHLVEAERAKPKALREKSRDEVFREHRQAILRGASVKQRVNIDTEFTNTAVHFIY